MGLMTSEEGYTIVCLISLKIHRVNCVGRPHPDSRVVDRASSRLGQDEKGGGPRAGCDGV